MADEYYGRREHDRRQRVPPQHSVADVGHHRVPYPRPPGTPACHSYPAHEDDRDDDRDRCNRNEWHERAHWRRQYQEDGDRQRDLHDLAGGALAHDGPQATADVMHLAPVTEAAMDVAGDTAREHEVEEHRPVVGGDGGR